jgi:transposase-like protein
MDSLFEDTDIEQLLELLSEQEEDEEGGIKSFFREKILEEVKKKFEQLMEAEREAFLEEEDGQEENSKNGYYQRDFDTEFGEIEQMDVPRDREGEFSTRLFGKYQRRDDWLEEAIIQAYARGMSTRAIANFLENLFGSEYSRQTISRITDITLEEVEEWKNREIDHDYYVIYIDAFVVDIKRDTVDKEAIYLVSGVNTEGYREVLGFYVGGNESAEVWKEILTDLKSRGLERVLLVVADELAGLHDAVKEVFPKADTQPCVAHKVRNSLKKVRSGDKDEVAEDLKDIYQANDRKAAKRYLEEFTQKWEDRYPRVVETWNEQIDHLLTFMEYPDDVWEVIYTTNWMERTIKEYRKRLKPMNSIPTIQAAEKIVYLKSGLINRRWSERRLRGFKAAKPKLDELLEERYPSLTQDS